MEKIFKNIFLKILLPVYLLLKSLFIASSLNKGLHKALKGGEDMIEKFSGRIGSGKAYHPMQKPYSQEDYKEAKKQGFDLDVWEDYEKFFGLGEDPEEY